MKVQVKRGNGPYQVPVGTALGDLTPDQIRRREKVLKQKSAKVWVTTAETQFKEGEKFTIIADKLGKFSSMFLDNLDAKETKQANEDDAEKNKEEGAGGKSKEKEKDKK